MKHQIVVVVVGPLPPPVYGASKNTAIIAEALGRHCRVMTADLSPGRLERGLIYHATKMAKVLLALLLVARGAGARDRRLYIPSDAGLGMYYTILVVALARLLGYRIFVHHRVFAYIDRPLKRMSLLVRCAGSEACHIFLCPDMKRRFVERYPAARKDMVVSNAGHVQPVEAIPGSGSRLRIGHLSNLGSAKGLEEVLETTRRLMADDIGVRLVLAGPAATARDARTIEAAQAELGDTLDYRGPVHGADKDEFYAGIDVFLFPTRYANEAQPNVLFEAMAFGVPSISYARGCVASALAGGGGIAVPVKEDFVESALPILLSWQRDPTKLFEARMQALTRVRELKRTADQQFRTFIQTVAGAAAGEADAGFRQDRQA